MAQKIAPEKNTSAMKIIQSPRWDSNSTAAIEVTSVYHWANSGTDEFG